MSLEPLSKMSLIEMAQNDPERYAQLMKDHDASSPTEFQESVYKDKDQSRLLSDYLAWKKVQIKIGGEQIKSSLPSFSQWRESSETED